MGRAPRGMHAAMSLARFLAGTLALTAVSACSGNLGPPRPQRMPVADGKPAVVGAPRSPRIANYKIDAKLDVVRHQVTATETLTWTNSGQSPVDTLPFHLYLNAFKNDATVFMKESRGEHRGQKASPDAWGWIDVSSIQIAGAEVRPRGKFPGPDETVLEVPLDAPVAPGQTIEVRFAFVAQLPEVFARTGFKGDFHMIGQWFPKIGVRVGPPGAETWRCEPFHVLTEFFADFGVYDVTLTVPDTHVVAATGVLTAAVDNLDATRTLTYHAEDVHDFAWMADPYMEVISDTAVVDGRQIEVRVYHRPAQREFARRHLVAGIGSIESFSKLFVPYPWPIMSVIDPPPDASGSAGGMEYPTLVTTAADHAGFRPGVRLPEFVTIHEIGHNWFQGILASNEVEEAWLDEGVNEWADGVVMGMIYGERGSLVDWDGWSADYFHVARAAMKDLGKNPSPIATVPWKFVDPAAYSQATYEKTALALRTLGNVVGRDAFDAAMKAYAREWAFRHPTGRDLFAVLERELAQDLSWFIGPAFYGTGVADLSVRDSECRPKHEARGVFGDGTARKTVTERDAPDTGAWVCEVVVVNSGTVPVPVDVEMHFADGTRQRETWDDRGAGHWHRFEFERSSPLVEVELDPDGKVLLTDDFLDDQIRLHGDPAASYRAGARAAFWTQTLMQGFGL